MTIEQTRDEVDRLRALLALDPQAHALADLDLAGIWVVHGGKDRFPLAAEVEAVGATGFLGLTAPPW